MIIKKILFVAVIYLAVMAANAESLAESTDFFGLDIEELANLQVSVASVKLESIYDTPAIVSRYDTADMAKMGLRTLKDILSFIPGFVVQNEPFSAPVMVRGLVEAFNQKILFLLDDVPYWMPSHSEIPLLGIPIESISHIEVIRGPGAVYYGTNASAGVIKVVTKKDSENTISLSGGSNALINNGGYGSYAFNEDTRLTLAFEVQRTDGYNGPFAGFRRVPRSFPSGTPTAAPVPRGEEMNSGLLRLTHKKLNFVAQGFESEFKGLGGGVTVINHNVVEQKGYLLHLDNTFELGDSRLKVYTDYNNYYLGFNSERIFGGAGDGGFRFDDSGKDNYRLRGGASIDYDFNDNLNLYFAGEWEERSTGQYQLFNEFTGMTLAELIPPKTNIEKSLSGQIDYRTESGTWRFLAGGRLTDNRRSGNEFTPRLSGIYKIDDRQSIKLLYSEGFNSPNFVQQEINIPFVISGNSELNAERVRTYDLAYTFADNKHLFVINFFYLEARDFIERNFVNNVPTFLNSGNFYRSGAELDLQRQYKRGKVFANLASTLR